VKFTLFTKVFAQLKFMKKWIAIISLIVFHISTALSQSIAINTDGTAPHASSMLDVKSTTKGLLLPRMSHAQRNAIASPAAGLIIYQTDNIPGFYYYNGGAWAPVSTGGAAGPWTQSGANIFNTNTGNIGVGVSDPAFVLDINDRIRLRSNGASAGLWLNNLANNRTTAFMGIGL
jgi:hypothetical protein